MMRPPTNPSLPFFAYGIFKPSEISFFQIKEFVNDTKNITIKGKLLFRDGLPIFDADGQEDVRGALIYFFSDKQDEAYQRISKIEPDKHYFWNEHNHDGQLINILLGKSPSKGSEFLDEQKWDSWRDPLFTSALEVIEETLNKNSEFSIDLKPMFSLQMAYLLLWSSIERYVSLRYHLGDRTNEKIMHLAEEASFIKYLHTHVSRKDKVYRADSPTDRYVLDESNPKNCLEYYYQIRSNITHRGKGINKKDHEKVKQSLTELLSAFREVLKAAKDEAAS